MKKIISILLISTICFSLTACSEKNIEAKYEKNTKITTALSNAKQSTEQLMKEFSAATENLVEKGVMNE